jgi:hypothetical protein
MSRKQQLLNKLPKLPGKVDRRLMSSTIAGLKAERAGGGFSMTGDPRQLVDVKSSNHWFWGRQYHQVPDRDVDLLKTNVARRKLLTFSEKNQEFRRSVNKDLSGGESYPILTTILGLGAGFVSAGAGFLWTGFTTALSLARDTQPVRVRDGDDVHQVEIVGVRNGGLEYLEWIILVDPFRVKANRHIKQWIIHDERHEVRMD